jgi:hypothetical protein
MKDIYIAKILGGSIEALAAIRQVARVNLNDAKVIMANHRREPLLRQCSLQDIDGFVLLLNQAGCVALVVDHGTDPSEDLFERACNDDAQKSKLVINDLDAARAFLRSGG